MLGALAALVALSRWLLHPAAPDDPDALNFTLGMARGFDLARLQPHFPGYPVYMALGIGLTRLGVPALTAATAISAVASGAAALGLSLIAARLAAVRLAADPLTSDRLGAGPERPARRLDLAGEPGRAAASVLVLSLVAWLPCFLGSSALSDALGAAIAVAAFAALCLEPARPAAGGLLAGLLLGARASYWPLVPAFLVLASRSPRGLRRALAGLAAGALAWAVPFVAAVGPRRLGSLAAQHLAGHFGAWGGTVATRPDLLARAAAFARGLTFDGLAPSAPALAAIVATVLLAVARDPRARAALRSPRTAGVVGLVLLPYALWAFLAQNVVEQPRHLLPLVEGGLILLAIALARHPLALLATAALAASATLPLALERLAVPSPPAQAASWIAANADPASTAVVAGRTVRFFQEMPAPFTVRQHGWLSEVVVDLSRFDRLPSTILLTSEVDLHSGLGAASPLPDQWRIEPGPQFCRDPRIDRSQPCLGLTRLVWSMQ